MLRGGVGVVVTVGVGVMVGVGVGVMVGVGVTLGVGLEVGVTVGVGVMVAVGVAVGGWEIEGLIVCDGPIEGVTEGPVSVVPAPGKICFIKSSSAFIIC